MVVIEAPELMTRVAFLASVDERRDRQRGRRDADAEDVDFVVDDHLLNDTPRIVGDAAVVAEGQFELSPGDGVAVLLHVKLDGGCAAGGRRR